MGSSDGDTPPVTTDRSQPDTEDQVPSSDGRAFFSDITHGVCCGVARIRAWGAPPGTEKVATCQLLHEAKSGGHAGFVVRSRARRCALRRLCLFPRFRALPATLPCSSGSIYLLRLPHASLRAPQPLSFPSLPSMSSDEIQPVSRTAVPGGQKALSPQPRLAPTAAHPTGRAAAATDAGIGATGVGRDPVRRLAALRACSRSSYSTVSATPEEAAMSERRLVTLRTWSHSSSSTDSARPKSNAPLRVHGAAACATPASNQRDAGAVPKFPRKSPSMRRFLGAYGLAVVAAINGRRRAAQYRRRSHQRACTSSAGPISNASSPWSSTSASASHSCAAIVTSTDDKPVDADHASSSERRSLPPPSRCPEPVYRLSVTIMASSTRWGGAAETPRQQSQQMPLFLTLRGHHDDASPSDEMLHHIESTPWPVFE